MQIINQTVTKKRVGSREPLVNSHEIQVWSYEPLVNSQIHFMACKLNFILSILLIFYSHFLHLVNSTGC